VRISLQLQSHSLRQGYSCGKKSTQEFKTLPTAVHISLQLQNYNRSLRQGYPCGKKSAFV
jgi:hypothetical protein